ncbi:MAG TPA: tetratricopeptide repeat protein, partial [Pirellulales bacterium]
MRKFQYFHWTIALAGCICWAAGVEQAIGQTKPPAAGNSPLPVGSLDRARAMFESGKYVEAEKLLAQVLAAIDAGQLPQTEMGRCVSPLADIYRAWGHYDDALKMALRYRQFIGSLKGLDPAEHDRQLVQNTCNLADIYTALGQPADAEKYLKDDLGAMENRGDTNPLPTLKLAVRFAQLADDENQADEAKTRWSHTVQLGEAALEKFKAGKLPAAQLPDGVAALAAAYVATGQNDQAIAIYRRLLQTQKNRQLVEPAIKTSKALGSLCAEEGKFDEATQVFQDAIAAQHKLAPNTAVEAELLARLAMVLNAQGLQTEAQKQFDSAAAIYLKVLAQLETATDSVAGMMTVLNQLQLIQQQAGHYPEAIAACRKLLELRQKMLGDEHPLTVAAKSDLGALYGACEYYDLALPRLTEALNYWKNRKPAAPLQLARALNDLAVVQQGAGSLNEARQLLEEALRQRQQFLPPDDPRLAHTYANLASVCLAKGDYSRAVVLLDQAIDIFRKSGPANQQALVSALLNQSMVFQSQGQLTKAIDYCRQALVVFQAAFGQDAPGAIDPCNKLSALCVALNQLPEAAEFSRRAWQLCEHNHLQNEPIAGTTLYQQAIVKFSQNRLDDAHRDFQAALEIQKTAKAKSQIPRTLNYLARIASLRGNTQAAEPLYRTALDLQGTAFTRPTTFYISSCNLAEILHGRGKTDEAVKLVQRALDAIETPRAEVTGGEREQAGFFEQYKKAFDLLVAWNLEQGNVDAAFAAAERGRNRTFLDQLSRAGIDLRDTLDLRDPLVGPKNQKLLEHERTLRAAFATLQAQAGTLTDAAAAKNDTAVKKLNELTKQLESAQQEYAQVLAAIRSASSYRDQFAENSKLHSLANMRSELEKLHSVMLFYYVGASGSYLLVIDPSSEKADVVPLVMPGALADSLNVPAGPIGRQTLVKLVNQFLVDVRDRAGGRGLSGIITTQEGVMAAEKGTQLADVILPRDVRSAIEKLAPRCVMIVPDGALDELSFEALLLENSPAPKYLLDVFPPIAYAPSANIFMNLLKRPAPSATATAGLTVGNPKYPQLAAGGKQQAAGGERQATR